MKEVVKVLISTEEIQKRTDEIAEQINNDCKGEKIILVGILKGSVFFMTDLSKKLNMPVEMCFMDVSSYYDDTESSGEVKINLDLDISIKNKNMLIVEDIIDTGRTLHMLMERLSHRNPASIKLAALLNKNIKREFDIKADYTGFEIPNKFVVGYGLDYAQRYRNLPYIGVLNFIDE
ncbi:MAG: hypoxanthine phosphoribosyltransferase [Clostridiales bacterium]|nr:hypoxanthine phosphoribosyltransferase [Clostridiales bacterium]